MDEFADEETIFTIPKEITLDDQITNWLIDATKKSREYLLNNAYAHAEFTTKPQKEPGKINPVTVHDKKAEKILVDTLKATKPAGLYLEFHTEEMKHESDKNPNCKVYIDPIDGTRAFIKGTWLCTTSIGAIYNGQEYGVVDDFFRRIRYVAQPDNAHAQIEYLSGIYYPLKMPIRNHVATGNPRIITDIPQIAKKFFPYLEDRCFVDISGSIALNLAQIAYGAYDGTVLESKKTSPYDIAAGVALVRSAKGLVNNLKAERFNIDKPNEGLVAVMPWMIKQYTPK